MVYREIRLSQDYVILGELRPGDGQEVYYPAKLMFDIPIQFSCLHGSLFYPHQSVQAAFECCVLHATRHGRRAIPQGVCSACGNHSAAGNSIDCEWCPGSYCAACYPDGRKHNASCRAMGKAAIKALFRPDSLAMTSW